jgi:hypothetical protein
MFSFCSELLEQLREQCKSLWGTSSEFYFRVEKLLQQLANPNLHDIPSNLQIHVELWDRYDNHVRWVIAATSSIVIGNAAYALRCQCIRKSVCYSGRAFV